MSDAEDHPILTAAYESTRKDDEYTKRIGYVIRLGRRIMEHLEPRHRHLVLEYERQIGLMQEIHLHYVLAEAHEGHNARRGQPCCRLVMPNRMPNSRF